MQPFTEVVVFGLCFQLMWIDLKAICYKNIKCKSLILLKFPKSLPEKVQLHSIATGSRVVGNADYVIADFDLAYALHS